MYVLVKGDTHLAEGCHRATLGSVTPDPEHSVTKQSSAQLLPFPVELWFS